MPATMEFRPLGMLEKLFPARQALGNHVTIIVTATYNTRSGLEDGFLVSFFSQVVSKLIHRHPALACYVEGVGSSHPKFMQLRSIDLDDVLQVSRLEEGETLAQVLQRLHTRKWPTEQKPQWQLAVLRDADTKASNSHLLHLAFVCNHAIADGLSGAAFQRSLLQEIAVLESATSPPPQTLQTIDVPSTQTLTPPIEELVKFPLSWSFLLGKVLQEYAPRWLVGSPPSAWTGLPVQDVGEIPPTPRVRLVTISTEELSIILRETKKNGVFLTSLLTATIVSTLANALPEASRFVGQTPYHLRRVSGTSLDEVVNQTSSFDAIFPGDIVDDVRKATSTAMRVEKLWYTAKYFQRKMDEELARCPRDNLVGLLPYVTDHINYYRKKVNKPRESTWEVSNLGVFKFPPDLAPGNWKLSDMAFTQTPLAFGPPFAVNCVSIQDGPMSLSITWQDLALADAVVDALVLGFRELAGLLQQT